MEPEIWSRKQPPGRVREAAPTPAMARRQAVMLVLALAALVALLGRIAWWQVVQGSALSAMAAQQTIRQVTLPAGRGEILDANGAVLAISVTRQTVVVDPELLQTTERVERAAQALSGPLGLSASVVATQLDAPGQYARLAGTDGQTLLLDEATSKAVTKAIDKGRFGDAISLVPQVIRVYPDGSLAAQTLGFVRTSDGKGQYGVEQMANSQLGGKPGLLYTRFNSLGEPLALPPLRQVNPVPGANVTLTLDAHVQYWAEQDLAEAISRTGAQSGQIIVMDPATGAIIAMASAPSFDPNHYETAPLSSFGNPVVSQPYDPGSVMKAVTMAGGVQAGVITPETTFYDPGYATVAGVRIWNFAHHAYGEESMTQVLLHSANVGAIFVARRVGVTRFNQNLQAFGFFQPTGVGLPGETAGLRGGGNGENPELTMAENAFGESIGVTPLQITQAYAALANGGVLMRPQLVASVAADGGRGPVTHYGPQVVRRVVSAQTAATVTQMLVDSARYSDANMYLLPGYSVAAKTGTSTPRPDDPSWTYASVIGYAPASHPRFVLLVKLDHPVKEIFGGDAAGPTWRELAQQLFLYYRIPPDQPANG